VAVVDPLDDVGSVIRMASGRRELDALEKAGPASGNRADHQRLRRAGKPVIKQWRRQTGDENCRALPLSDDHLATWARICHARIESVRCASSVPRNPDRAVRWSHLFIPFVGILQLQQQFLSGRKLGRLRVSEQVLLSISFWPAANMPARLNARKPGRAGGVRRRRRIRGSPLVLFCANHKSEMPVKVFVNRRNVIEAVEVAAASAVCRVLLRAKPVVSALRIASALFRSRQDGRAACLFPFAKSLGHEL